MAYNNYFPQYYPPYPQMTMPIYQPQVQTQPQQPIKNDQIQSGGFVSISNESMVNSYPIAPGNCVTFKIEGKPIVIEKSMGFSQLESPKIKRYKLVEEENTPMDAPEPVSEPKTESVTNDAIEELKDDIEQIRDDIDDMQKQIDALKDVSKKTSTTPKKRSDGDV